MAKGGGGGGRSSGGRNGGGNGGGGGGRNGGGANADLLKRSRGGGGINHTEKYTDGIPGSKNRFNLRTYPSGRTFLSVSNTQLRNSTMAELLSGGSVKYENWSNDPGGDKDRVDRILDKMQ